MSDEKKNDATFFPTWLQVLVATSHSGDDDDSWVGKLRAVKKSITDVGISQNRKLEAFRSEVKTENSEMKKKFDDSENKAAANRKAINIKLNKLAADNAEMKKLLLQIYKK